MSHKDCNHNINMKDPVTKFRFDEDSDTDYYNRHNKRPPDIHLGYEVGLKQCIPDDSPLKSSRPNSEFIDHVPNYTDNSMNYLEADQDLSPIRGDYGSSPTSRNGLLANQTPSAPARKFYPTHNNPNNYHYDSGFPMTYKTDYSDHNSNLLSTSPNKDIPDKNLTLSRDCNIDSSQSYLDVSKSASSGDSRGGDYNGSSSNNYYSDRIVDSRPQSLKRAREQNLRDNLRHRSTSLGETVSSRKLAREAQRPRTPSAPGELSHNSQSYLSRQDNLSNIQSPAERSLISDKSRSVLYNRSIQGRLSRIDMDRGSLSRSIMSGEYRVRDHDKSALSSTTNNDNSLIRGIHTRDISTDGGGKFTSLTPIVTNRKHSNKSTQPNGAAKLLRDNLDQSKQSLDLSKVSLNGHRNVTMYCQDYGVINSLVSLAFMALLSLVIVFISIQLLFHLNNRTATGLNSPANSVLTNSTYGNVLEVTIALTTFVMMLDVCCLLVCSMQCFFAAKLVKCSQGDERCFKYLKECAGTRFIAVTGFFVSIPTLLIAFLLYMLMEFTATPAIIATVILTVGLTFTIITIVHSTYFWRVEKNKADLNIPAYEKKNTTKDGTLSQSELSTLV